MPYKLILEKRVVKILEKIQEPDYSKIKSAILNLANNPRPQGCKKLKGREGYRIRSGDYRIIYSIHDKELIVHIINLGHRKEIYN